MNAEIFGFGTFITSNYMFEKAIWDKLPECIFLNFDIARIKQGQFENFRKLRGLTKPNTNQKLVITG